MRRTLLVFIGAVIAVVALVAFFDRNVAAPVTRQETLSEPRVHAYRDWQNMAVQLREGDLVAIRASGEWLYTPHEVHGPQGHPRYPAPDFYPIPYAAGGVLIGRIGEKGEPFVVGKRTIHYAYEDGPLYLRINDDRLGDNWGSVVVDIEVTPYEEE